MLGFEISERSVLRWMRRTPRDAGPGKRWMAFLQNHCEAIAAMDFFTIPTGTFVVLYVFFVIAHDRRRILHLGVTKYPSSTWVTQQLREAFPDACAPGYLIFDRATNFSEDVIDAIKSFGRHSLNQPQAAILMASRSSLYPYTDYATGCDSTKQRPVRRQFRAAARKRNRHRAPAVHHHGTQRAAPSVLWVDWPRMQHTWPWRQQACAGSHHQFSVSPHSRRSPRP